MTGRSFGGCLAYNLEREEAQLLYAEGVRTASVKEMTADFNMQRRLNPSLGQAVGHIVLSWSKKDNAKLNEEAMVAVAQSYLAQMKIRDTQYIIVRHSDRSHPHVHLVYNRVSNEGKTISDRYQKRSNAKVCRVLTEQYGYHLAEGKGKVNRQRLRGADQMKYEIHDALSKTLKVATNWPELEAFLNAQGIDVHYKYLSGTANVQGVSFSKGEARFKGSALDRNMSYLKLDSQLRQNGFNKTPVIDQGVNTGQSKVGETVAKDKTPVQALQGPTIKGTANTPAFVSSTGQSFIEALLSREQATDEQVSWELRKIKRKKKKGRQI